MRRLLWVSSILLSLILFLDAAVALSQAETFCPSGQQHFSYGFAFLKSQLGEMMGEPLECEHYDIAGNASQQTTTGQAFYHKDTNTPMFTAGKVHWAWTPAGLEQWTDDAANPEASVATPLTKSLSEQSAEVASGEASLADTPPAPGVGARPTIFRMDSKPVTVRVMSYNILFGAGVDPGWEQAAAQLSPFAYPGNRLPEILTVIKAANPDILGIQEAANWDSGSPPIAQQVAKELGMNYFLATTKNDLHLALFTKFKIIAAENLSERMGNVGALRATLSTPDEKFVQVFVVHLDPFAVTTRAGELAILTQEMSPYLQTPTLLIGDMNFYCLEDPEHCQEYRVLSQAGWRLALAGKYKIDQIWTSPVLDQHVEEITFPGASFDISDHLPLGAIIDIYPTH